MKKKNTNDSDLADLLGNAAPAPGEATAVALNLDHLTTERVSVTPHGSPSNGKGRYSNHSNNRMSLTDFISNYISMLCYYYPKTCAACTVTALLAVMCGLGLLLINPTQELGVVHHHANIRSKYDLTLGQVDHWCLRGGDDRCQCEDPLVPLSRSEHLSWVQAFKANRQMLQTRLQEQQQQKQDINIAFVGESVIEAMGGRWMGSQRSMQMKQLATIFRNHFQPADDDDDTDDTTLNGVALGIAGDTAPNVLWRLLHGELPEALAPKIFWISLGMNDLARMECSEEIVVLGILRVVEELLEQRPSARIVINSIFPMGSARGGVYPILSDFGDAFTATKGNGGRRGLFEVEELDEGTTDATVLNLNSDQHRVLRKRKKNKHPNFSTLPIEERAEAIEKWRDEMYHRKHHAKKVRPVNPVLQSRHKIKKYDPIRKRQIMPFWVPVQAINRELESFARENDRVRFFDATPLFLSAEGGRRSRLDSSLITMRGHPTVRGFIVWEDAIQRYATNLLEQMKEDEPELFEKTSGSYDLRDWLFGPPDDPDDVDNSGDFDDNIFKDDSEDLLDDPSNLDNPGGGRPSPKANASDSDAGSSDKNGKRKSDSWEDTP